MEWKPKEFFIINPSNQVVCANDVVISIDVASNQSEIQQKLAELIADALNLHYGRGLVLHYESQFGKNKQ